MAILSMYIYQCYISGSWLWTFCLASNIVSYLLQQLSLPFEPLYNSLDNKAKFIQHLAYNTRLIYASLWSFFSFPIKRLQAFKFKMYGFSPYGKLSPPVDWPPLVVKLMYLGLCVVDLRSSSVNKNVGKHYW